VTNGRRRDVPRSPTGRVPQWVRDEADGKPSTPTPWRAAPSTFLGEPTSHRPRSRRGRNAVSTLVVAGLVIAAAAWSVTGHNLLPQSTPSTQAAAQAPTGAVARNAPPVGQEEAPAALGAPAVQAGASTSFRFKSVQPGSTAPVTWSPCRPIHYVVRPDNTPPGGEQAVARAVAAVSHASGLRFVFDGPASEALVQDRPPYQPDVYGDRWAPVLIAWATVDEVPDFGVDIAGEASTQKIRRPGGQFAYVTGVLYLDAAKAIQMRQHGNPGIVQAVIEHELGHLVGLAHVNDPQQVMFPRASGVVLEYGTGDRTGLAVLGRGGCTPDI
jgi:hypothetical protein